MSNFPDCLIFGMHFFSFFANDHLQRIISLIARFIFRKTAPSYLSVPKKVRDYVKMTEELRPHYLGCGSDSLMGMTINILIGTDFCGLKYIRDYNLTMWVSSVSLTEVNSYQLYAFILLFQRHAVMAFIFMTLFLLVKLSIHSLAHADLR